MANTVIALKKSATPSAVPADLANGEIALNYSDGVIFYKHANGTVAAISSGGDNFGTVNANGTLIVADTQGDILTLLAGDNIGITGDAVNDRITIALKNDVTIPGLLTVSAVGGDEGGEIQLANALTNSILTGNVVIDVYQNRLRFYEQFGTNRGAYINLASTSAGVGTDLLAGSSGTDSVARDWAASAFAKANTAGTDAVNAFAQANTARDRANTGVTDAGNAFGQANVARTGANTVGGYANSAYGAANLAWTQANTALTTGQGAYGQANTATTNAGNAFGQANVARNAANTVGGYANSAYGAANLAWTQANTALTTGQGAYGQANTATTNAGNAFGQANVARNAANTVGGYANSAFNTANLAFAKANTADTNAVNAYGLGNSAFAQANTARDTANTAGTDAVNAFAKANAAISNTSGVAFVGDVYIPTGNLFIGSSTYNANATIRGSFLVTQNNGGTLDLPGEIAEFSHNANNYAQIHVRNANTGTKSSGDIVVTADVGTDSTDYLDLGLNGSAYADSNWTIVGPRDGYLYTSNGNLAIGTANTGKSLVFFTGGTLAANEDARFDPSGNLLIGRTSSTVGLGVKLDINGAINASAVYINGVAAGGGATIVDDTVNATRYVVFVDATSGTMSRANVDTVLSFNPSTGTLSSTIFNSTSDANLKYDIAPVNNAVEIIEQINGVKFKWKDNQHPSVGVIAQEVEKVLPELVVKDKYTTVNYNGLIAVLIEAIKELKADIEKLKSK